MDLFEVFKVIKYLCSYMFVKKSYTYISKTIFRNVAVSSI